MPVELKLGACSGRPEHTPSLWMGDGARRPEGTGRVRRCNIGRRAKAIYTTDFSTSRHRQHVRQPGSADGSRAAAAPEEIRGSAASALNAAWDSSKASKKKPKKVGHLAELAIDDEDSGAPAPAIPSSPTIQWGQAPPSALGQSASALAPPPVPRTNPDEPAPDDGELDIAVPPPAHLQKSQPSLSQAPERCFLTQYLLAVRYVSSHFLLFD